MKKLKLHALHCFLLIIFSFSASSQFTETREFSRKFKVTPETRIEISNKYGKIDLNTWEKDSVVINVSIKIEERKLSKLEQTLNDIDFDFTFSDYFLIARTRIGTGRSPLENEIMKLKETVFQSGSNLEINLNVWLPGKNNLKVENKFGDIFIDDYLGETEISLSNGNLKANDFKGKVNLLLNFADASINSFSQGRIDSNYSDIFLKSAGSVRVTSKSTTWEILEIKNLNADSRRDKFRIRMANTIDGKGSFTSFRLNELIDKMNVRSEYGDLDIEKINQGFSTIFIESKSTDINLYFNPESAFRFDITHTKSEIDFCSEMKIEAQNILEEKDKKTQIKGYYGKKATLKEKLFINSVAGQINVFTD